MNIGGRGQVAVEANTVQCSATQSHAGGQVSARVRRAFQSRACGIRLRWREAEVALMFVACECWLVGWVGESSDDDCVVDRRGCTDDRGCTRASTD